MVDSLLDFFRLQPQCCGELRQFLRAGVRVQPQQFRFAVERCQGGLQIPIPEGTGEDELPLSTVPSNQPLAFLLLLLDQQIVGAGEVFTKLAIMHAPSFYCIFLPNFVMLLAGEK